MKSGRKSRGLSVIRGGKAADGKRLTRAQVAERLGVSISTVRRYEGERLRPEVGEGDVRWFDAAKVAALAAELANEAPRPRLRNAGRASGAAPASRSADELAALVFERFEQRQSLAEIVLGVRISPDRVRALHAQWCQGLIEGQLRMESRPWVPLDRDYVRRSPDQLAALLAELPHALTRISVGRYRGEYMATTPEDTDGSFAHISELGGFHVSGPCDPTVITERFGNGSYRVSAYGFDPPMLRWEVLVAGLAARPNRPTQQVNEPET